MKEYKYRATELIAEAFDEKGIKYTVETSNDRESVNVPFAVDEGPLVRAKFLSRRDNNDVAVRIFGLINNITEPRRARVMEACNILNRKVRYVKFYLDDEYCVNMEYDFPASLSDDCVGEVAHEITRRMAVILDNEYGIFMKAMYTDDDLEKSSLDTLHARILEALERRRRAAAEEAGEADDGDDLPGFLDADEPADEPADESADAAPMEGEVEGETGGIQSFADYMRMMTGSD